MLFFDPVLRQVFGGDSADAAAILADDDGIEQLIERLEELDEEVVWDA
jgi:tetrahydromethanopterin S-methyltransferase subunit G